MKFVSPRFRDTIAPRLGAGAAAAQRPDDGRGAGPRALGYAVLPSPVPRQSGLHHLRGRDAAPARARRRLPPRDGSPASTWRSTPPAQLHLLAPRTEDKDSAAPAVRALRVGRAHPLRRGDAGGDVVRSGSTLRRASPCRALVPARAASCPRPRPPRPFPSDGVAAFGDASPIELCLGTARVVSPRRVGRRGAVCVPARARTAPPCSTDAACDGHRALRVRALHRRGVPGRARARRGRVCRDKRCTTVCAVDADCADGRDVRRGRLRARLLERRACHYGERCDPLFDVCVAKLCSAAMPCAPGETCEAESVAGELHEPEVVTVGGATVAYVELRSRGRGPSSRSTARGSTARRRWTADPVDAGARRGGARGRALGARATGRGRAVLRDRRREGDRPCGLVRRRAHLHARRGAGARRRRRLGGRAGSDRPRRCASTARRCSSTRAARAPASAWRASTRAATRCARRRRADRSAPRRPIPLFWRDVDRGRRALRRRRGRRAARVLHGARDRGQRRDRRRRACPPTPNDSIGLVSSCDGVHSDAHPGGPVFARVTNLRAYLGERRGGRARPGRRRRRSCSSRPTPPARATAASRAPP